MTKILPTLYPDLELQEKITVFKQLLFTRHTKNMQGLGCLTIMSVEWKMFICNDHKTMSVKWKMYICKGHEMEW